MRQMWKNVKKLMNLGKNRWDSYLGKNTILASSLIMNFRIKTKMNKFMYCSPRPNDVIRVGPTPM